MSPAPHLVALDIDGTILTYHGVLTDPVRHAIQQTQQAGHHVVIATGRSVNGVTDLLRDLELTRGYAVCSNGAVTISIDPGRPEGYRLVDTVTFNPAAVIGVLQEHLPEALYATEIVGRGIRTNRIWPDRELHGEVEIVPIDVMKQSETTRVVVRSPSHTGAEFSEIVHRIGLHGVSYSVGYTAWLDLAPEGVSKASGLEQVRRWLHVPPEHTVAVGDGRNDLDMVHWAAHGVAMDNSVDELKEIAVEVTGNVDDDGLADALAWLY